MKSSTYYSLMKTKILADFHIYISVPLMKRFLQDSESNLWKASYFNVSRRNTGNYGFDILSYLYRSNVMRKLTSSNAQQAQHVQS